MVDAIDKIFLLSVKEVVEYFGDSGQLEDGKPEEDDDEYDEEYYVDGDGEIHDMYSEERVAYDEVDGVEQFWWLRSPGSNKDEAAMVGDDGHIDMAAAWNVNECLEEYNDDEYTKICIRPAMWIKSE